MDIQCVRSTGMSSSSYHLSNPYYDVMLFHRAEICGSILINEIPMGQSSTVPVKTLEVVFAMF